MSEDNKEKSGFQDFLDKNFNERHVIVTEKAPGAIGPYSQATHHGKHIFVSGQLPIDVATGEIELNDIKKATTNSMNNIKAILEQAGAEMKDIVKTQIFLTDLADFEAVNEVYGSYFENYFPARSCIQVAGLPKGAKVEIEVIAVK